MNSSEILERVEEALEAAGMNPDEYDILGDKIYPNRRCLKAMYTDPMTPQAAIDNTQDGDGRASGEHFNASVATLWNAITFARHQRVQVSQVAKAYIVAVLLTNAYSLFEGNQTLAQMTDVDFPNELIMPTPESYFEVAALAP